LTDPVGRRAARPARRRLLALGFALVGAVTVWLALTAFPGATPTHAPAFRLPRLGGGAAITLPVTGDGAHRPVVLTFFASWCSPCLRELPMIAGVARAAVGAGTPVAFIGIDGNDDPASGLAFARSSGVTFPVAADARSAVAPRFSLVGYPGTVFIDGSGTIVGTVHGPVTRATLEQWVARLARPAAA
jgi:thiol-disulfide isomerase/thioredoxin